MISGWPNCLSDVGPLQTPRHRVARLTGANSGGQRLALPGLESSRSDWPRPGLTQRPVWYHGPVSAAGHDPVLKSAAMRARRSTGFEPGPILRPRHLRSAPPCHSPGRETYCAPAPPAPLSSPDRDPCTSLLGCPVAVRPGQIAPYDRAPPLRLDALPSR